MSDNPEETESERLIREAMEEEERRAEEMRSVYQPPEQP